jgi:hypothetical protein
MALPLALMACTEPEPAPLGSVGTPPTPPIELAPEKTLENTPPEAEPAPGESRVSTEELELAVDMVRAQTGGPEQIADKPELSPAEIDALLYKIAMDPEASAIYAHETSPTAAELDPPDMDKSPPPRER